MKRVKSSDLFLDIHFNEKKTLINFHLHTHKKLHTMKMKPEHMKIEKIEKSNKKNFSRSVLAYFQNSFGGGSKEMTSAECEANAVANRVPDLGIESPEDLECIKTVGTGTFGRVMLVRNKQHKMDTESSRDHIIDKKPSIVPSRHGYYALKVLNISQVIKLQRVQQN